ncbi:MAG: hypothetical protein ACI955_002018 [Zhongshania sp.]|jgi:hypothetical protein
MKYAMRLSKIFSRNVRREVINISEKHLSGFPLRMVKGCIGEVLNYYTVN